MHVYVRQNGITYAQVGNTPRPRDLNTGDLGMRLKHQRHLCRTQNSTPVPCSLVYVYYDFLSLWAPSPHQRIEQSGHVLLVSIATLIYRF